MAQIFLSYSHSDGDFVELIEPRIARIFGEGVLWYDRRPDGLRGGQIWWNEIRRQIQECQIFLFLLSDESAKSKWCTKELEEAVSLNKTLIPVLLETYSSKGYPDIYSENIQRKLEEIQFVDLRGKSRFKYDDLSELWGAINRSKDTRLSLIERWLLYNQYEIIKSLERNKDGQKIFENEVQQVLQLGYEFEYGSIMPLFEKGISHNDCKEVIDILNTFLAIERAKIGFEGEASPIDVSDLEEWRISFRGFDGNFESEQYVYAKYLFNREDLELIVPKHKDLNSGSPMMHQYRRMIRVWRMCENKVRLFREDIVRIAEAATISS